MSFRSSVILTLIILFSSSVKSQDPEFSQFYANPLYLNPAMAGAESYSSSYDQFIPKLHGGLGVIVSLDDAGGGILRTFQASLMYAYYLRVGNDLFFNMAMQAIAAGGLELHRRHPKVRIQSRQGQGVAG